MEVNKKGTVRPVTYNKYVYIQKQLAEISPSLKMKDLNKFEFQNIINIYSETHERQTIIDFYHIIKGCIKDAVADGDIDRDPTLRTKIPEGVQHKVTHEKFWDVSEYEKFLRYLYTKKDICRDDFVFLLIAKTGLRFAEALGVCPEDFDFDNGKLAINKTWDYKSKVGKFMPTKNFSSNREVILDYQTKTIFKNYIKNKAQGKPIFIKENKRVFNSMFNDRLFSYCKLLDIKKISIHSLRHTYASLLLTNGVSIESISKYLGHSDTTVTQKVYLHLTKEMADKDDLEALKILNKF